ncbi:MAG: hypothetical protein RR182_00545 [Alistipes sp.]
MGMALPYTRPQAEIFQILESVTSAPVERMGAVVVGPNYKLARYGQENIPGVEFKSTEFNVPYEVIHEGSVIIPDPFTNPADATFTKLYAEDLRADIADIKALSTDKGDPTIVRCTSGLLYATDGSPLQAELDGLPVQPGDILSTVQNGVTKECVVSEMIGQEVDAVFAAVLAGSNNVPAGKTAPTVGATVGASADITIDTGALYTGKYDTTYVATVVSTTGDWLGSTLSVVDTVGNLPAQLIVVPSTPASFAVGNGFKLKVGKVSQTPGVSIGDVFYASVTAAVVSTTKFNGMRVSSYPVDMSTYVPGVSSPVVGKIQRPFTGEVPRTGDRDSAWVTTDTGIKIYPGMSMYIEGRATKKYCPFVNGVGKVFASYRTWVKPAIDEGLLAMLSLSDVQETLGTISRDNPLAFAAATSIGSANGNSVFALRIEDNTEAAYMKAVKTTESDISVYAFTALTQDLHTMQALLGFAEECSNHENMRYRKFYFGIDSPGEYIITNHDSKGNSLKGTIGKNQKGDCTVVQFSDAGFDLLKHGVSAGDIVRSVGRTYTVKRVLSKIDLELVTGPATPITSAVPMELWASATPANTGKYLAMIANSLKSTRAMVIWSPDGEAVNAETMQYETLSNMYVAAEYVGLRGAMLPQQSMTRTELTSVTRIPKAFIQYGNLLLDKIAASGVCVVTQDSGDGACYVRHQLTTQRDNGLLQQEDSMTVDIDNICFDFRDVITSYIGKYNVVDATMASINNKLSRVLANAMATSPNTASTIGPALVRYDNLTVSQDPVFKDRAKITVTLYIPGPLNNIQMYVLSFAAQLTI